MDENNHRSIWRVRKWKQRLEDPLYSVCFAHLLTYSFRFCVYCQTASNYFPLLFSAKSIGHSVNIIKLSSMSFWGQNKVGRHPSPVLLCPQLSVHSLLPFLARGWQCGFFSGQDQPLSASGVHKITVWASHPYYCFFTLGAKQKHAWAYTDRNLPPSNFISSAETWRWGKDNGNQISETVAPNYARSFS